MPVFGGVLVGLIPYLQAVSAGRHLTAAEAYDALSVILQNEATDAQIAAFLVALHMKGETSEELAGFARALRAQAVPVPFTSLAGEPLLDTCGTGGDGHNTFNISTTAAFVIAGCGVRVAKHGNRAASGMTGSADVLEELGVRIAVSGEHAALALREVGICFLFAQAFHPATKQVQSVRRELKVRTAFNLLGPLSNPAPTSCQIVGTPSIDVAARVAGALAELGLARGFVVHGDDGLDEVTLTTLTHLFEIVDGAVQRTTVVPEDFGMQRRSIEELRGGSPTQNAEITRAVLDGMPGACRDIVLANAALGLVAARRAQSIEAAVPLAVASIDSGAALEKLRRLAAFSSETL